MSVITGMSMTTARKEDTTMAAASIIGALDGMVLRYIVSCLSSGYLPVPHCLLQAPAYLIKRWQFMLAHHA
jgi:hypothetical protein